MLPDKNLLICLLLLIFLCVGHQKFVFPSKLGCQLSAMNLATSFSQVFHGQSVHPWLCNPFSRLRGWLRVEAEEEDMVLGQTDCYCCAWLLLLVAAAHFTLVFGLHSIFTTQRYSSKLEMGEIFRKIEQKIAIFFPIFLRASLEVPEASLFSKYFVLKQFLQQSHLGGLSLDQLECWKRFQ